MIIESGDLPDIVQAEVMQYALNGASSTEVRNAVAAALTAWEGGGRGEFYASQGGMPLPGHDHHWDLVAVEHTKMIVLITNALKVCRHCGEHTVEQLTGGHWTEAQLRARPANAEQ
jgi:hypothetical protein